VSEANIVAGRQLAGAGLPASDNCYGRGEVLNPLKTVFIVLVCLILAVAGVVAASTMGLIDIRATLSKIPYVDEFVAPQTPGQTTESYAALKQENDSLKKQVQTLTMEDEVLSKGSQSNNNAPGSGTGAGGAGGLTSGGSAAGNPVFDQAQQQVYQNLANYYASMKPESAVAILGNQDPQMVSEILYEMDKDAASQILAAMDPVQAAKLLKLIAEIDSEVKAQSSVSTSNLGAGE
jgi:flagellar motility protein MotE (MotC chaperone)